MSQSYLITDVLRNVKLLKILGITFFSVENGKSVTRLQDVLYMLTTIGIGAFICYYSLAYSNDVNSEDSKIASIGNFLVNIASIIIVILSVFITFLFRHKIWFLAQKLDTIELKVSRYLCECELLLIFFLSLFFCCCYTNILYDNKFPQFLSNASNLLEFYLFPPIWVFVKLENILLNFFVYQLFNFLSF
ncbi:hypothetical protein ACKWTF_010040 [Chironomus riparius]